MNMLLRTLKNTALLYTQDTLAEAHRESLRARRAKPAPANLDLTGDPTCDWCRVLSDVGIAYDDWWGSVEKDAARFATFYSEVIRQNTGAGDRQVFAACAPCAVTPGGETPSPG